MKKHNLITPEGTRDLLFGECNQRRKIEAGLMELFKENGYSEVITPLLEFYDVFDGYFRQENMYKLTDAKGRLMVLRPDSTIPIIRLAETRLKDQKDLPRPLKLCYNQTIYRANPKESGRDDEIAQCGVEIVGVGNDAKHCNEEILKLAARAVEMLDINYRFEIGNCMLFESLAEQNNIKNADEVEKIRELVEDKKYSELSKKDLPKAIAELPKLFGGEEVFEKAEKLFDGSALKQLEYLKTAYNNLCKNMASDKIVVDLGLTNKRGYYTGTIFNGYVEGYGKPVLSGGRYILNGVRATGFAVNVSAVATLRR